MLIMGAIFIIVVLFLPKGLVSLVDIGIEALDRRRSPAGDTRSKRPAMKITDIALHRSERVREG
jgi:hypothetical protein